MGTASTNLNLLLNYIVKSQMLFATASVILFLFLLLLFLTPALLVEVESGKV